MPTPTAQKANPDSNYSRLGLFEGSAFALIAERAEDLMAAMSESVQNSLDEETSIITIVLNRKTRHIAVRDDGRGVDRDQFEVKLRNSGRSQKKRGDLGRHGLGFLAFLGKCEYFTFTSCPK